MLTIYGTKKSSAFRCHWLLTEIGLEYETRSVDIKGGENRTEAFLKMNPNGKIPVLVDGDFTIFESFAINAYLAEKYRPEFLGSTLEERALVQQWNIWALANLADAYSTLILQHYRNTPDNDCTVQAHANIDRFLKVLDGVLTNKTYLVAETLTIADINISSMVNGSEVPTVALDAYPNVQRWAQALLQRSAVQKLMSA